MKSMVYLTNCLNQESLDMGGVKLEGMPRCSPDYEDCPADTKHCWNY